MSSSLLSLLRMAVGDFDYDELESSHYFVGAGIPHSVDYDGPTQWPPITSDCDAMRYPIVKWP